MAGKKKVEKVEKDSSSWVGEIEKYSRQIWLAGLGAYSKVSKDGSKLFDTLVEDGHKAEKLAKKEVEKQVGVVKHSVDAAKSKVEEVKDKALGKWSELEEAFDKRLNSAIARLGVPSRNEVKALQNKVDTLTAQLEKLTGLKAESAKPAVRKVAAKPAAKAAAKPVAAKPAVKKPAAAKPAAAKPAATPAAKPVAAKPAAAPSEAPVAAPAAPAATPSSAS